MTEFIYNEINGFSNGYDVTAYVYLRNGRFQENCTMVYHMCYSNQFRVDEVLVDIGLDVAQKWAELDTSVTQGLKPDIRKIVISEDY